jgi:hypothetical protein
MLDPYFQYTIDLFDFYKFLEVTRMEYVICSHTNKYYDWSMVRCDTGARAYFI